MLKLFSIFVIVLMCYPIVLEDILLGQIVVGQETKKTEQIVELSTITQNRLIEYLNIIKPELNLLKEIDSTIVRTIDLTLDGEPDTIKINVKGESILSFLKWTCEIISKGTTIYYHESEDARMWDSLIGHYSNTEPRLLAYLEEKSSWYFKKISESIVQYKIFSSLGRAFGKNELGGIYHLFPPQLNKLGITDKAEIDIIINNTVKRLLAGVNILEIPKNTEFIHFPRVYVTEINTFLVFYEW